ncbi:MAG: DUF4912 domain-containing protein [Spirulina sp.]
MVPLRSTLALSTLALGVAVFGSTLEMVGEQRLALAEETLEAPVFTIPDQLPANAALFLEGSSAMAVSNEVFRQRMVDRYPNLAIQVTTSDTEAALEKLRQGTLDLAAIGRRLTEAERGQGLVEVPISREKIALIVGTGNAFSGDLTPDQLAQMFYGEINNWTAVGGPDLPLRFVDRPASSDTRQALGSYPAFSDRGLTPGPTVAPVAEDSTEAVVAALGNDGIGYAVVSQVQGRDDLRLLTVDGVLPTDARYPYSQPRVYVYNSRNPSPTALAFLGVVNTPANLTDSPADLATVDSVAIAPVSPLAAVPQPVMSEVTPLQPRSWGRQGQSWGWLLAIPLLGGLLWWLLRTQEKPAATASPIAVAAAEEAVGRLVLVPRHCRRAYAYWEIPDEFRAQQRERGGRTLMLRLLDVTNRDVERHPPARIDQFPVTEEQQDLHIPIPTDDRDYQAELGYVSQENHWLPLAKSAPVRVPACATDSDRSENQASAMSRTASPALGVQTVALSLSSAPSSAESTPAQTSPALLTLHPNHHRMPWDEAQYNALTQVAATHTLSSGTYLVRIQRGQFSYGDPTQPGEPLALLGIDGGPITTPKNPVPTPSLWATLNGYTDTLTLTVENSALLRAFFIDTNPDTNQGQVILSIQRSNGLTV